MRHLYAPAPRTFTGHIRVCVCGVLLILAAALGPPPVEAQEPQELGMELATEAKASRARRSRVILFVGLGTAAVFMALAMSGWLTPNQPDK